MAAATRRRRGCAGRARRTTVHAGPRHDDVRAGRAADGCDPGRQARDRGVDCFYVYPTVSDQPAAERDAGSTPRSARSRATRRRASRRCAGCTRRCTASSRCAGDRRPSRRAARRAIAYRDVRAAWRDYLAPRQPRPRRRADRPLAGLVVLAQLVREEIDPQPRRAGGSSRRSCSAATCSSAGAATPGATSGTSAPAARDADRLRDRLLDVRRAPGRTRCSGARRGASTAARGARRCCARTPPRWAAARRRSTRSSRRSPFAPGTTIATATSLSASAARGRDAVGRGPRRLPRALLDGERRERPADRAAAARRRCGRCPTPSGACTSSTRTSRSATSSAS